MWLTKKDRVKVKEILVYLYLLGGLIGYKYSLMH